MPCAGKNLKDNPVPTTVPWAGLSPTSPGATQGSIQTVLEHL